MNSIVWRYNYDLYQEADIKNKLIIYNLEDCTNLKKLKDVINAISSNDTAIPDVMAANEKNQLLSTSNKQVVTDFTTLIKSAHGKYENSKISWAKNNQTRNNLNKSQKGRRPIIPKSKVDKNIRVARGRICPLHKRTLLHTDVVAETVIINLVCTPKGIKKQS